MYPFLGGPSLGTGGNWEALTVISAPWERKCSSSMAVWHHLVTSEVYKKWIIAYLSFVKTAKQESFRMEQAFLVWPFT